MTISEETKQRCREMLLEMHRDLVNDAKANIQSNTAGAYLGDLGDCATSAMEAEYVYMISERLRQRLFLVEQALDAIGNGDFGICTDCGKPINEKRLLFMPFALWCDRC